MDILLSFIWTTKEYVTLLHKATVSRKKLVFLQWVPEACIFLRTVNKNTVFDTKIVGGHGGRLEQIQFVYRSCVSAHV